MVLCSLFASLTAVCAWISLPLPPISFTMQTFAVLLSLGILGGKWGSVSILLYLLLGLVGLPVFSGFRGGIHALLGPTGGFLWGFLLSAAVYWALERLGKLPAMIGALAMCYLCGSWWFSVYAGAGMGLSVMTCVVPYLIPDAVKLALAYTMAKRISRTIQI
nr:biotin transporter BioY [Oscillospiraceae bacterium]